MSVMTDTTGTDTTRTDTTRTDTARTRRDRREAMSRSDRRAAETASEARQRGDQRRHGAPVRTRDLVKTFDAAAGNVVPAVDHVDLDLDAGSAVALTGPSGSGKSTLLHLIGAIEKADSGSITVGETEVTALPGGKLAAYRRTVGFVFQRYHLLPALTALDNVLAPVLPLNVDFDKEARARDLLAMVGLAGREHDVPSHLSGGQQQRVAIARALIHDPAVILADEPTGNLDSRTGEEIVDLLLALRAERGTTLLLATHDLTLASRCDTVVRLRDGQVIEVQQVAGDRSTAQTLESIERLG
jgi:putative ABC transport system ATP-binding protein